MTRLYHQYLPMIYAFQPDEAFPGKGYLVMQDIPGITLRQYVNLYGAVSQKQTFAWLRELLEAVDFLHRSVDGGIMIHCDIKPEACSQKQRNERIKKVEAGKAQKSPHDGLIKILWYCSS